MTELAHNIFIGTVGEINENPGWKIVNLAHTYHYKLHEWGIRDGVDRTQDKCYVVHENSRMLSINWIDANEAKYFDYNGEGVRVFEKIFNFITKFKHDFKILIVCNKGHSRAPSVGMAYLAKKTDILSTRIPSLNEKKEGVTIDTIAEATFEKPPYGLARDRFLKLYPDYLPGQGITEFLIDNWDKL